MIDHQKLEDRWKLLETEGTITPGVNGDFNPLHNPPDWYDPIRFKNAQKISRRYFLSLNIAHFIGNVLLIHLPDVLVPVVATGNAETPFMVFKRILSTVVHILSWYDDDPFDVNSKTYKSLLTVRRNCHMAVSRLMNSKYPQKDRLWLSQFDMAMTQWSLIGIVAIRPKQCGFYDTTREEFEEYHYFWKVMGHCVGIKDRFNVCLDNYDESTAYLHICYDRCYKVHLDRQCQVVKLGMDLTEGVFLALNSVTPRFLVCHESFMKYWYDTLGVKHSIKLDTFQSKLYYWLSVLVYDYLLRVRLFYVVFSWLFFFLLKCLFGQIDQVKNYTDQHFAQIKYRLKCRDWKSSNESSKVVGDNNNNIDNHDGDIGVDAAASDADQFFSIHNYLYKPNV